MPARRRARRSCSHTRACRRSRRAFPTTTTSWRTWPRCCATARGGPAPRGGEARAHGVDDEQLVLDPGIDLAKTPAESVEVIRRLPELAALGRPLLLAVSRKDFVGALTERPPAARLAGTLAAVGAAADGGAAILRIHDVAEAADFLRVQAALRERDGPVPRLAEELRREPA